MASGLKRNLLGLAFGASFMTPFGAVATPTADDLKITIEGSGRRTVNASECSSASDDKVDLRAKVDANVGADDRGELRIYAATPGATCATAELDRATCAADAPAFDEGCKCVASGSVLSTEALDVSIRIRDLLPESLDCGAGTETLYQVFAYYRGDEDVSGGADSGTTAGNFTSANAAILEIDLELPTDPTEAAITEGDGRLVIESVSPSDPDFETVQVSAAAASGGTASGENSNECLGSTDDCATSFPLTKLAASGEDAGSIANLCPLRSYRLTIYAVDNAGNRSAEAVLKSATPQILYDFAEYYSASHYCGGEQGGCAQGGLGRAKAPLYLLVVALGALGLALRRRARQ